MATGPLYANNTSTKNFPKYLPMTLVSGLDNKIKLSIHRNNLQLDLSRSNAIKIKINAARLYQSVNTTASFNVKVYDITNGAKEFITSQSVTTSKGTKSIRFISLTLGYFKSPTKTLEFVVSDTLNNLINTYSTQVTAINLDKQTNGGEGWNLNSANCDPTVFNDCQIEYLLHKIIFEAKPQSQISTRVTKEKDGYYKVSFPVPKSAFKFLGARITRNARDQFNHGQGGSTNDLNGGTNIFDYIVLNGKTLLPTPVNGAIEYDGNQFYFTSNNTRNTFITNSDLTGLVYMNPAQTVSNKTLVNTILTGSLRIPDNAGAGKVLTSDAAGNVTWSNAGLGAGFTDGSVIFANSSGNLTEDNNNFYFDNTNNRLGLGNNNPLANLTVNGTLAYSPSLVFDVVASSGINIVNRSAIRIRGSGASVNISANPQITTTNIADGQILTLIGTDDSQSVTINNGQGLALSDGLFFTLGQKDTISFYYDNSEGLWIEISRVDR